MDFPSEIRLGQTVPIELTLSSSDIGFTESFAVMPITIEFDYGTLKQDFLYYTDENGSLYYEIQIPNSGITSVDYIISFPGTAKIDPFNISDTVTIDPKLTTTLELDSPSLLGTQRAGTFAYSATLTDSGDNPVPNVTVYFRIYDENSAEIDAYSSMTNNEGVAAISITIETTGTFSVTAEFEGEGVYAVATSASADIEVVSNIMYYVRMLPYIGGGLAVIVAAGFIYQYAVVVPKRKKRLTSLKAIHQRFSDVENIQYILILTKAGLSVFSRSFTSVPIEETLISGFLTAISSFGAEIGGKMKGAKADGEKGLEQLSYKQFKIIVNDAALVRTAVLLLKDASPSLKEKLKRFNLRFQELYMDMLQNFTGEIPEEGPILEMVEQFLEVDLLYPHNVNAAKLNEFRKTMDKKSINRKIIEAGHEAPYHDTFYIRDMMNHLREVGEEDIHIFNGIIELREEHAVFAINPRTRSLIDQFKPIIDQLPGDSQLILLEIFHGVRSENQLRKTKGILDYNQGVAILIQMGLINNELSITPTGEAVATILRLV
ncbi:MAG: Ig-like domain-containing protein [Promethearchaeota archaeon]